MNTKRGLRFKIYENIKKKILYFEYKPGDKLSENEIAKGLKISRTPVREALLMLENENLVYCDDRLGFIIRKLSSKEGREYFSIRNVIELFAVPLIIEGITLSEMKHLEQNIREAQAYVEVGDFHNIIRCETEFHEILYKSTKSEVFFQTISGLIDKFQWLRGIALSAPGGARESLNDHKEMFEALERKDVKKLKRLTKLHLQHAEKKYAQMQGVFL